MSDKVSKKTFDQMVNIVLEHGGTPRRHLYEYPYNDYESRALIAKAESAVRSILKVLNDAEQSKS